MAEILDELTQYKGKIEILESLTQYGRLHTIDGVKRILEMKGVEIERVEILKLLEPLIDKRLVDKISEQGRTFYYITFEGQKILENIKRAIHILK